MIVANIEVALISFGAATTRLIVPFDKLEDAKKEYERLKEILTRTGEAANDVPATIEVTSNCGHTITCRTRDISSIGLQDFALANEMEKGVADEFPHLFKKKQS